MPASEPIGLVAGSGKFPLLFAEAARAAGREVVAVAHEGETDPALPAVEWVKVGQLARIVKALRSRGCTEAVLCGGIRKPKLLEMRPDWLGVKVLARATTRGDDAGLRAIAKAFEEEGVRIVSPLDYVPQLIAPRGPISRRALSDEQRRDVEAGLRTARVLGAEDVGQTVVVKNGFVLAVEAAEGTDACIARGGALAGEGAVVVKICKPQQDLRFDVPAVGAGTLAAMRAARCVALAVEAERTLLFDRGELAAAKDLAIEGV